MRRGGGLHLPSMAFENLPSTPTHGRRESESCRRPSTPSRPTQTSNPKRGTWKSKKKLEHFLTRL